MIKLDYSKALLSAEQIAAFAPKAEEAQKALEAGTCAGNDFLGWLHLPSSITAASPAVTIRLVASFILVLFSLVIFITSVRSSGEAWRWENAA